MGKQVTFVVVILLLGVSLAACGPSQAELDEQATKVAADIFATQTAEAPTLTPTPTSTSTPTSTPTPTPTTPPTPTPTPTPTLTPTPAFRVQAQENSEAFLSELAGALEVQGWEIKTLDPGYISIEREGGLRVVIEHAYHSPEVSRLIIHVIFLGAGPDNLKYDALYEFNRLNSAYNLTKVYVDDDGDLWFDDVYHFGETLDVKSLSEYLQWYVESLDTWVNEWLTDYL